MEPLSPIDGRYKKYTEPLRGFLSEAALIRYRVIVEGEYLIALSEHKDVDLRDFSPEEKATIRGLYDLSEEDVRVIRDIELHGHKGMKATQHDVKAIEYFLKEKLSITSLRDVLEWIHFGLTSEDVNNLAYGLMLGDALREAILPALKELSNALRGFADKYKNVPMLARTHGQPASPTTFGKEFKVFEMRVRKQLEELKQFRISVKLNGASGNYNAHVAAYPNVDWIEFSRAFVGRLARERGVSVEINLWTTQIEPHDTYAELFDSLRRINVVLIDFCQDIWRYTSDGWLVQKKIEGEIGSSAMPHKINPIKFENAEGNLGVANALFGFFSNKLPISRLQRDLSDSTVERNFGAALGHSLVAYRYILEGLDRVAVDERRVREELEKHPEVLAEAVQTILRREGVEMPYEKLKAFTQGKTIDIKSFHTFVDSLDVSGETKRELKDIAPENYIGLAEKLAKGE